MSQSIFVVPCYNEAKRIELEAFHRFVQSHGGVDFLFVNDGSTDNTLSVLVSLTQEKPSRFRVLDLERNGGKAEAVRRGILKALESKPDHVGFLDADLATPLHEVPRLIGVLGRKTEMALAIGVRLPLAGHTIHRNMARQFIGRWFSRLASGVLGLSVTDTQCGAKIFRADELTAFLFSTPFSSRWIFDVEILARFIIAVGKQEAKKRIYELPLDEWIEVPGSKLKSGDFFNAFWELASIYFEYSVSGRWRSRYESYATSPTIGKRRLRPESDQRQAA